MRRWLCAVLLGLLCAMAQAQERQTFGFVAPSDIDAAEVPTLMRDLAERVLPVYQDDDPDRYLANLAALQWASGNFKAALETRSRWRERGAGSASPPAAQALLFDLYARAKADEAQGQGRFAQLLAQSFGAALSQLGDLDAAQVMSLLEQPRPSREAWRQALDAARGKDSIELPQATALVRAYFAYSVHRQLAPLAATLSAADDRRRYVIDEDRQITTPAGVVIHARIVRPKRAVGVKLPTLLEFTLLPASADARVSAAHGYVGVVAYTRGKFGKPDAALVPFRYDGVDARAVIHWIARQPWSDGRVGMYGDGYAGFAAWAASKVRPKALKAIATLDPMAPGISFPMQGHIFSNDALRWAASHAHAGAAPVAASDDTRWQALDRQWYASGKPYRDLATMAGLPRSVFGAWLHHPSYDRYWQRTVPFAKEFARIGVPVLTIARCDTLGALYFYREHLRHRPAADHTLLLVPCAEPGGAASLTVDAEALRYQWFDHVFGKAAQPALLGDRVNYRLPATGEWRHVPSLAAMANGTLKLYPAFAAAARQSLRQRVDLADRRVIRLADAEAPGDSGVQFRSAMFAQPVMVGGIVAGELDLRVNKYDVDLVLSLYEQRADGRYRRLAAPYRFRASYARDDVNRHLLKAGVRQKLRFSSAQIVSERLASGSRLVAVLDVNRRADQQINYGAGNDVSVESIADAKQPIEIRWYRDSHLDVPIHH